MLTRPKLQRTLETCGPYFRLKDGKELDLNNDTSYSAVYDEEDGFLELTCLSATADRAGKYKCMAKNSVGRMTIECDAIIGG